MTTRKKNYRRRSSSRKKRHQNAGSSIPSDRMKQLALIMIELIGPKKSQELGYRMMTPQSSTPRLKDNPSGGGDSASESENTFSDDLGALRARFINRITNEITSCKFSIGLINVTAELK